MASVFKKEYAKFYDRLYGSKDYDQECLFLQSFFERELGTPIPKEVLDLGCGTGGHAIRLAQAGSNIHGLDLSEEMLEIAREKAKASGLEGKTNFEKGNIQSYSLGKRFDAIICMFAVLGYQTSNDDLFSTLKCVREHLKPGGVFIADFWYGPAVLKDRPGDRVKVLEDEQSRLIRLTHPEMDTESQITTVRFHTFELEGDRVVEECQEAHQMRYFFCQELAFFCEQAGLRSTSFCPFLTADESLNDDCWNATVFAKG